MFQMLFFFLGFLCGILAAQEVPTMPKVRPWIEKGVDYFSKGINKTPDDKTSNDESNKTE